MPEKEGAEEKSTKSVVNKKQKQMMGEEGYDIARDMGKVRPSKDKKDATTMPPSKEMRKTQKVNKGPSALDIVKKKYKGQIMDVGKKKANEELDLTQVAEAFGGYIVEAPTKKPSYAYSRELGRGKYATDKIVQRALKAFPPEGQKLGSKEDPEIEKQILSARMNKGAMQQAGMDQLDDRIKKNQQNLKKVQSSTPKNQQSEIGKSLEKISPDRYKFVDTDDRPTGETTPKKSTATRANYPKTRAELEAKRKEYEIDPKTNRPSAAGIEKYARKTKQSNLPLSQDDLKTAEKRMAGTGEKGTDVGKYGGRLGRRRGSNQPTFDQVKADIDKRNPTYTGQAGGQLPFPTRKTTVKSAEDLMKDYLKKEKEKGKNIEDIEDDPRLKDIERDPQGREIRGKIERETGTRTRPFTRIGKTSGDIIKTDPKTGKETEVTPSGRVKPIGTLGRRAEKAQQQSKLAAFGGFLAKSAVPATAGLEAAERLRKGEKGVALSAIQAMDIPVLSKAAGIMNAIQTVRRGQQAAADQQAMVDVATGGGGGGRKGPKITSSGGEFDREGPKPTKGGEGLAAVGGDGAETDTVTSRILATQLPNIGKRLRRGAGSVPRGLRGGTVGRRSAGGFTAT